MCCIPACPVCCSDVVRFADRVRYLVLSMLMVQRGCGNGGVVHKAYPVKGAWLLTYKGVWQFEHVQHLERDVAKFFLSTLELLEAV